MYDLTRVNVNVTLILKLCAGSVSYNKYNEIKKIFATNVTLIANDEQDPGLGFILSKFARPRRQIFLKDL
jgi:hypothetical protein